jgi:glycosyltransferase involved in cell wall biosynthesis
MEYTTLSNSPLVSVIIPSFNHEQYIEATLQSVANQTYENIQLILIDDTSSDETVQLAARWLSERNERFSSSLLIKNRENLGADKTINRGILEANGEYVAILNSDDLFMPTRLTQLVGALVSSGRDVAFSKVVAIDDCGTMISPRQLPKVLQGVFDEADRCAENYPAIGFGFIEKNIAISTGNLVIRRSLFEKIGYFRCLKYIHDWDFILRSILVSEPVYVPEELYSYRIHNTNSFSELSHIAQIETEISLKYFRLLAENSKIENELAPLRCNWPGLVDS